MKIQVLLVLLIALVLSAKGMKLRHTVNGKIIPPFANPSDYY